MKLYRIKEYYFQYLRKYYDKVMYKDFRSYVGIINEKNNK